MGGAGFVRGSFAESHWDMSQVGVDSLARLVLFGL